MIKRAVTAALFVVLAGCSGDDDDTASVSTTFDPAFPTVATSTMQRTPTTSTSSIAPASSVGVPSTSPTTTTTSPTTTTLPPPTTAPSASTTAPVPFSPEDIAAAEEADRQRAIAVEGDWREFKRLRKLAVIDPNDSAALERALAYTVEPWTGAVRQLVARYRERGERLLPEPLVDWKLTVESPPVPVAFTSDEVTIITCEIDGWVRVGADGSVVDDMIYAKRDEVRLRFVDGVWKTASEIGLETWPGSDRCLD